MPADGAPTAPADQDRPVTTGISWANALTPAVVRFQAIRTDLGRPSSNVRFRAFAATATSVA